MAGQRWVSDSEPELGLGFLLKEEFGRVEILFPAVEEKRVYSMDHTPVRRVLLREGERLVLDTGEELLVREVLEEEGSRNSKGSRFRRGTGEGAE